METQRKLELNPINARTQQTMPPPTRFPLSPSPCLPNSHKCPVAQIRLYQPSLPPPPTSIHPSFPPRLVAHHHLYPARPAPAASVSHTSTRTVLMQQEGGGPFDDLAPVSGHIYFFFQFFDSRAATSAVVDVCRRDSQIGVCQKVQAKAAV